MAFELIVEDGSVVLNANSYASKEQIDDFLENEGIVPPTNVYYLAAKAASRLDGKYSWLGRKVSKIQPMQWPRTGLGPCNIDISFDIIPPQLIKAQLFFLANGLTNEGEEGVRGDQALRRKKVGNLEIEFFDSKSGVTGSSSEWITDARELVADLIGAMFKTRRV